MKYLLIILAFTAIAAKGQDKFPAPNGYYTSGRIRWPDLHIAFEVHIDRRHQDSVWIAEVEDPMLALHCLLYHPGCYFPGAKVIVNRGAVCRFLEKKYGLRAIDAREHVDGY